MAERNYKYKLCITFESITNAGEMHSPPLEERELTKINIGALMAVKLKVNSRVNDDQLKNNGFFLCRHDAIRSKENAQTHNCRSGNQSSADIKQVKRYIRF